jgi:nicotinamidase-related amidase
MLRLSILALLVCGCGVASIDTGSPRPSRADADGTPAADAGTRAPVESGVEEPSPVVGIAVIDVQATFVSGAANKDIAQILDGTKTVLQLAGSHKTPLLMTYEHSKTQSGYTLASQLAGAVPAGTRDFIKITFAATGLPAFASAITQLGLTHVVLLGAETDVCVLQTALGLRSMNRAVLLLQDTVFTSEPNTAPALRRMKQAGVALVQRAQLEGFLAKPPSLPARPEVPVRIVDPFNVVAVLNHLDDAALSLSADPQLKAKQARLHELLLISEWFDIPLYGTATTLPAAFAGLITTKIQPLADLPAAAQGKQVILAGSDQGLPALVASLSPAHPLFIMEDGLIGSGGLDQPTTLEGFFSAGTAVPTTYKTFYYEMVRSVDVAQWPKAWLDRYDVYFNKTSAPEDLPPIR